MLWHRGGINVIYHLLLGFASACTCCCLSGVPLVAPGLTHVIWIGLASSLVWRAVAQPLILVGIGGPFLFGIAGPMQWITILRSSKP